MATKKPVASKKTTAPKATRTTAKKLPDSGNVSHRNGLFNFFRFSETYTSLILGVVVVIIATVLLIAFFQNQHTNHLVNPTKDISYDQIGPSEAASITTQLTGTIPPTPNATSSPIPVSPTPRQSGTTSPTLSPTEIIQPTATVTRPPETQKTLATGTYTVKAGDDLWHIAEAHYKDGYQWVAIARANNLSDPNTLHSGDKLNLPKVSITPSPVQNQTGAQVADGSTISGTSYTIQKGDNLWNIAVRAYGDGYQWVKIASANGYTNPNLIHSRNVVKIPR